jgi:hypothetical protein
MHTTTTSTGTHPGDGSVPRDAGTDPPADGEADHPLDPPDGTPPAGDAAAPGRPRSWWWTGAVVGLAVLAGLALWGVRLRAEDATASGRLVAERAAVRHTLADIRTTEAHLAAVTARRDKVTGTLALESTLLRATESQLSDEQSTIASQGTDISELSSCLDGVQEALNAISLGDDAGGIASLEAVVPACRAAGPSS